MSWAEIKKALNSTVGTENFRPLDQIVKDAILNGANLQDLNVTKNGEYTADVGYDAIGKVNVNVPQTGITPTGTKTITANGTHDVKNYANAKVDVSIPDGYIKPTGTKDITTNGTHTITSYDKVNVNVPSTGITPSGTVDIKTNGIHDVAVHSKANVQVPITAFNLQEKTVTPTTEIQTITADDGYDALKEVEVDAVQVEQTTITANGEYSPSSGKYFDKVTVAIDGDETVLQETSIDITENKTVDITPENGVDGFSKVTVSVNVPIPEVNLQTKTATPTTEAQRIEADEGYDGLEAVEVGAIQTEEKTITTNGEHSPTNGKYFSKVTVAIEGNDVELQEQSIEIKENKTIDVTPEDGYDGLSKVTVSVNVPIPEGYIVPEGTIDITENGEHTITSYDKVNVSVPIPEGYIVPEGTIDITENGEHDVAEFEKVNVLVESEPLDKYFEGGYETVNLPNATKIKHFAFYEDKELVNISMPNVTDIGASAFSGCNKLALTELPNGLTSIGQSAFYNCFNLALTELPNGVTNIGYRAFYNCSKIALASLPSSLTEIGGYAFYVPSNNTSIAITEIPSSVTKIGEYAFWNCSGIKTLTFKSKPTSIGNNAFHTLMNLNVPWAEGEVAGAPWGATMGTINYNYTEDN